MDTTKGEFAVPTSCIKSISASTLPATPQSLSPSVDCHPTEPGVHQDRFSELLPPLPYDPPSWSGRPREQYSLEVIKNGVVIQEILLPCQSEFVMIGRIPLCAIVLDHPTISRFHAVLQFSIDGGAYLIDLKSSHGTFLNKIRLEAYAPQPLTYGSVVRFGQSSRLYVYHGERGKEAEAALLEEKLEAQSRDKAARLHQEEEPAEENIGASWGMSFDEDKVYADERDDRETCSYAQMDENDAGDEECSASFKQGMESAKMSAYRTGVGRITENIRTDLERVPFYAGDPKKALRHWTGQQGLPNLHYNFAGDPRCPPFECTVSLPHPVINEKSGQWVSMSGSGVGDRKKEAEIAAALDFCRQLDVHGFFDTSRKRAVHKKKYTGAERDEEEDDEFYDRTCSTKKRVLRARRGLPQEKGTSETYESLLRSYQNCEEEISDLTRRIQTSLEKGHVNILESIEDDMDAYLERIGQSLLEQKEARLAQQLQEAILRKKKVAKLVEIAKPSQSDLFFLGKSTSASNETIMERPTPPSRSEKHGLTPDAHQLKMVDLEAVEKKKSTSLEVMKYQSSSLTPKEHRQKTRKVSAIERSTAAEKTEFDHDIVDWLPPDAAHEEHL